MRDTENLRVRDLIDEENMEWLDQSVMELFTQEEANMIMRIPLSFRKSKDRLVWHYDKSGVYKVKTGYHVASTMEAVIMNASSSCSSGLGAGGYWKIRIPPKIKNFAWRLCKDIIPTRVALSKKVKISDSKCVLCKSSLETALHLFKECPVIRVLWDHSMLQSITQARMLVLPVWSVSEWLFAGIDAMTWKQLEVFCALLWTIWTERNNIIWKDGSYNTMHMAEWAVKMLEEYHSVQANRTTKMKRLKTKWSLPPSGRIKVNIDGAFLADKRVGGIGVVARDEAGNCVAAFARHLPYANSVLHMEAEAFRAGLLIAIDQGWDEIEVESDCATLLSALASTNGEVIEVCPILVDCRHYLEAFNVVLLRHVFREANGVANRLAHLARSSNIDEYWIGETPDVIWDVLIEDGCNHSRGLGNMSPSMYDHSLSNNTDEHT